VNVTELWIQSCRKQDIVPAPTRETLSSQYHTHHRLDALRKAACALFRSQEVAQVLSKVAVHIDKKLIAIRSDRDLHLDFGM
jgi:abnormal spindle-like microcephaly-associated protein